MKILLTGSSGFLGTPIRSELITAGHSVTSIVRSRSKPGIFWNPSDRVIDASRLEGYDAVIHLAGESIGGRFTNAKKSEIIRSRKDNTEFLVEVLMNLKHPPKHFISASGIGYYGNRGDEELTEASAPGTDFLATVCIEWEKASAPLASAGIRTVHIRTGIVLHPDGGALQKLLLPFKLGVGGPIGSGRQWWSWILRDDIVNIYRFVLENDSITGAVNAASPNPVRNKEFVQALGKALRRPAFMPLPAPAVKLLLGEMGDALLLSSQRVNSKKISDAGYMFTSSDLIEALSKVV